MNPNKPFADLTSKHLKPLGFKRAGNHWRISTEETHIAIKLKHCSISGELSVHIGAWIRRIEDVDVQAVKPDTLSVHVKTSIWHLLPRLNRHYFSVALRSILPEEYDKLLTPQEINFAKEYASVEETWMVEESCIKNPPIGLAAKTRIFESALAGYLVPFVKHFESEAAILACVKNGSYEIHMQDEAAHFLGLSIHDQSDTFLLYVSELDAKRHLEIMAAFYSN